VLAAWAMGGLTPMVLVVMGGALLSLPSLNPAWPWPSALAFLGARGENASPVDLIWLAVATCVASVIVLLLVSRRSAPAID
ncbi:MAG: hypothetical protein ACK5KO_01495, partial [Arachnia sp.]